MIGRNSSSGASLNLKKTVILVHEFLFLRKCFSLLRKFSLVVDIITPFLVLFRHGTVFAYIVVSNIIKPKWNYAMTKQLNREMSHNVCYHPSSDVLFLRGFELRTDVSLYYIRLYFDKATGMYFYSVRDSRSSLRVYSCGFYSDRNAILAIRDFVSIYHGRDEARRSFLFVFKECA